MSSILDLTKQIQDTQAQIVWFERAVAKSPDVPSVAASLRSMTKRMARLQAEFSVLTANQQIEVARYRVFNYESESEVPKLAAVLAPLLTFQTWLSVVYEAVKTGSQRKTSRVGLDVVNETSLGMAYTFSGSMGIVLTLQEEKKPLFGDSDVERSILKVFEMSRVSNIEGVQKYVEELGPAPVRLLYKWASEHEQHRTGAQIDWNHQGAVKQGILVQWPEFRAIKELIETVGDTEEDTVSGVGKLVAFDFTKRTFKLEMLTGQTISGTVADELIANIDVHLVSEYYVRLKKTTIIRYSKDENDIIWSLLDLKQA